MKKIYHEINDVALVIFNDVLHIEEQVLFKTSFKNVTISEIHTIAAIGKNSRKTMSEISRELHITMGTLTTSINNLVKKGYVTRSKDEKDRRLVFVELTKKGRVLFRMHAKFHTNVVEGAVSSLDETEQQNLLQSLEKLSDALKVYSSMYAK